MPMADLAVILLTFNEEMHIQRAIASVSGFAREVYVVDSHSTDATVELARASGAIVSQNTFLNQAQQFQWALDTIETTAAWIMRLDADEVIEPDLAAEIEGKTATLPADVVGLNLDRKHIFMGRWIRHGGRYPVRLLRIWRRGCGHVEDRWMDEHMFVHGGTTIDLKGGFADHNLTNLDAFTQKHNRYATREAVEIIAAKYRLFQARARLTSENASAHASAKRFLKERLFNAMPFPADACCYVLFRYFLQLGFLDGREGLIYHVLQGFWYRFLVGAKVVELERAIAPLAGADERLGELARLTGLRLT